jgi:hypothetical protein
MGYHQSKDVQVRETRWTHMRFTPSTTVAPVKLPLDEQTLQGDR